MLGWHSLKREGRRKLSQQTKGDQETKDKKKLD
jgi:hypothetical protein